MRRRRMAMPISPRRSVYEWTAIVLLFASSLLGPVLFGAVRIWSVGPLMMMVWLALGLYSLRPLLREEARLLSIPPGGLVWLLAWIFFGFRISSAAIPYEAWWAWLRAGSYLAAYWIWTELSSRHRRWRFLLGALLLVFSLLAWYAIIQHAQGSRMVLNLERPEQYGARASGTYFCPNHYANLLALVLPFALALLILPSAGVMLRLLSAYSFLVLLPALYLTGSRSGWLSAAGGLALTAALAALRKSFRRFLAILVAVPLAFLLLAGALWTLSPMVRERFSGARIEDPDPAVRARFDVWRDTLPMIAEKPLLGHGGGSYPWVHPRFRTQSLPMLINYAHNEYLHFASDYGLVGLGLFGVTLAAVLLPLLLRLRRVERDKDAYLIAALCGSVATGMVHAVFDFNFHIYSNNHVLVLLAGVVAGGLYGDGDLKPRRLPGLRAALVWGGGLLAGLALLLLTLQVVASYGLHLAAEHYRDQFKMAEAERLLQPARRIAPGNPQPWASLGHLYRTRSFWDFHEEQKAADAALAEGFYQQALERNPFDTMALYGLARLNDAQGRPERALELLRKCNDLYARNIFFTTQLGLQLRKMERFQEALEVFRGATEYWSNEMIRLNIRFLERKLAENPAPAGES